MERERGRKGVGDGPWSLGQQPLRLGFTHSHLVLGLCTFVSFGVCLVGGRWKRRVKVG